MGQRKNFYWLLGLLSLIGFLGVFTDERIFLAFFAFAVDFQYLFIKSDEMMDEYMTKSASRAFYFGMVATAIATLVSFFALGSAGNESLMTGLGCGWIIAVFVHALSTAYYGFRESFGVNDD